MWLVTRVDFCYGWSLWVFLTWLPSYLSDARGFRPDQMALMTTLPLLGGVVGDTLGGVISDAIFRRTGNLRLARRTLLVVGLAGAFVFIVPAVVTGSAIGAVSLLAAAFFFLELTNAVLWTLPLDIAGRYAGTAGGIMNTGFGVAGMISPVVFGVLIQRTGRYELPFFISAGLLLVGALCSLGIDPTSKVGAIRGPSTGEGAADRSEIARVMRVHRRAPRSGRTSRASICALSTPGRLRRSIARGSIIRCCCSAIRS